MLRQSSIGDRDDIHEYEPGDGARGSGYPMSNLGEGNLVKEAESRVPLARQIKNSRLRLTLSA
jgi:hypothetical protein